MITNPIVYSKLCKLADDENVSVSYIINKLVFDELKRKGLIDDDFEPKKKPKTGKKSHYSIAKEHWKRA
jgi:hypothetical protein